MNKHRILGLSLLLGLALSILLIESCKKDKTSPDLGSVAGIVTSFDGLPLPNVKISAENEVAFSDFEGFFLLEDIPSEVEAVLSFSLDQYVTNYKSVLIVKNKTSVARAALSSLDVSAQANTSSPQNIDFSGASISLPANGLVDQNGDPYNGEYTVKATYFDPTKDNYFDVFPGDFTGVTTSGQTGLLESYGFIDVTLENNGKSLNLAEGQRASISIPIPAELLTNAPNPIPLFFFEEETATWIEEGSASIENGKYVGNVVHFSSWNADFVYVDETCTLTGRVVDQNGTPINLALVTARGIDFSGGNTTTTGSDGRFSMTIKSDAHVVIYAQVVSQITGRILGSSAELDINPTCPPDGSNHVGDLVIILDGGGHEPSDDGVWWDVFVRPEVGGYVFDYWAVGRGGEIKRCNNCIPAVANWEKLNSNTSQTLLGVHFTDSDNGWICGNNGTFKKTTNGGDSWQDVALNFFGNDLYEVVFYGDQFGCVVGTVGNIWYTHDGGTSWTKSNAGIQQDLYDVDFVTDKTGWAVGTLGKIYKTEDGGVNWASQNSSTNQDLNGVSFVNELIGWAVGLNGTILRTRNGGDTWETLNSGTSTDLLSVDFFQPNYGVAVGRNGITLLTQDGGESWVSEDVASGDLWDVELLAYGGIIGGEEYLDFIIAPQVPPATNGWTSIASPIDNKLTNVNFIDDQNGLAVGYGGAMIRTNDQGSSWSIISSGSNKNLWWIDFVGDIGYVCGDSETILKTEDGGLTWITISYDNNSFINYNKVQFMTPDIGWIMNSEDMEIIYTEDGGLTWLKGFGLPQLLTRDSYFSDIFFLSNAQGYVIGYSAEINTGFLYSTTDGGHTWQVLWEYTSELTISTLNDLFYLNSKHGWISGFSTVFNTKDNGASWSLLSDFTSARRMQFIDEQRGWSIGTLGFGIGGSSSVMYSRDGGIQWFQQGTSTGLLTDAFDIEMINDNVGVVVGGAVFSEDGAVIYKTTTGGF